MTAVLNCNPVVCSLVFIRDFFLSTVIKKTSVDQHGFLLVFAGLVLEELVI